VKTLALIFPGLLYEAILMFPGEFMLFCSGRARLDVSMLLKMVGICLPLFVGTAGVWKSADCGG
jgi:hypothetical protein